MFLHLFIYKIKDLLRSKEELFWCSMFPIILGTLFYFGFGNLMNGNDVKLSPIPVAVVTEEENEAFMQVLDTLGEDSENPLLSPTMTDAANARRLLDENEVDGILYVKAQPSVTVKTSGISQTLLQSFVSQYLSRAEIIQNILKTHPEQLENAVGVLSAAPDYNTEKPLGGASLDPYVQYFYALIAMACLYASMAGVRCAVCLQANMSDLGIRRAVSPTHKLITILSDFLATLCLQFAYFLLLMAFLTLILKIDFGSRLLLVILTGFTGILIGTAMGLFIGSAFKKPQAFKASVATAVSMLFCFLSGLMVGNMKDLIEHACPILNRINPAALITDSLYALNMYEDFTRFGGNLLIMTGMAVVLCFGSYLFLRRNSYANL